MVSCQEKEISCITNFEKRPAARNLQQADCAPVDFPVCQVSQKLGIFDRHVLLKPHHYDISSNGEGQPDEVELNGNIVHRGQSHWGKWKSGAGMEHSPSALVQENRL